MRAKVTRNVRRGNHIHRKEGGNDGTKRETNENKVTAPRERDQRVTAELCVCVQSQCWHQPYLRYEIVNDTIKISLLLHSLVKRKLFRLHDILGLQREREREKTHAPRMTGERKSSVRLETESERKREDGKVMHVPLLIPN
jgi:hypothetical protein